MKAASMNSRGSASDRDTTQINTHPSSTHGPPLCSVDTETPRAMTRHAREQTVKAHGLDGH